MADKAKRVRKDVTPEEAEILERIRAERAKEQAEPREEPTIEGPREQTLAEDPVPEVHEHAQPVPPEVSNPDPQNVMVWTEQAQELLDVKEINAAITRIRTVLAQTKLNRLLSGAGLLEKTQTKHDKQWREIIADQRKTLDWLVELRMDVSRMAEPKVDELVDA